MNDNHSLSHSKWNCKYHVLFAPKYRRMVIYNQIKSDIGKIVRKLCEQKGVEIIEAEACPDHIHMLVTIPPKTSVSSAIGGLKGKSSLMILDRFANLKYSTGTRCSGEDGTTGTQSGMNLGRGLGSSALLERNKSDAAGSCP